MLRRGWAVVCFALGSGILAASCSGGQRGANAVGVDASVSSAAGGATVPESDAARARLHAIRTQFATTGAIPSSAARVNAATLGSQAAASSRSAIELGAATGFELLDATHVRPAISGAAKRGVLRSATVTLPTRADGAVELEDDTTHVAVTFALRGARESAVEAADGLAVYRGAYGGGDVVYRPHAEGIEDYVVLDEKPAEEAIAYDVDVTRVAGLRLVSNVLEFLDEGGAPRLRVASPYVVDAGGRRDDATIAVEGCAFDTDAAGPWGRPVTSAGASSCAVRVRWSGAGYPVLVDPVWTATGSMTTARERHTATLLGTGKVLITGGETFETYDTCTTTCTDAGSCSTSCVGNVAEFPQSSAELFDGTSSFAATGAMTVPRRSHTATLLASGQVLIAGGEGGPGCGPTGACTPLSSAELFDGTSTFSGTGSMTTFRYDHTATRLTSGKVLVAGGFGTSASADLFDGTSTFSPTGPMMSARWWHTATLLPSGKVLVAGGVAGVSSADVFDGTASFTPAGPMVSPRSGHTATLLGSGKVLLAGGNLSPGSTNYLSTAELFDGTSSFAATGAMTSTRQFFAATLLGSGEVLVAGGYDGTSLVGAELFDGTSTFSPTVSMATQREYLAATLLLSGKLLVTGGQSSASTDVSSAELLAASNGEACSASESICKSGFCVDGYCCNTACDDGCDVCAASLGAPNDGTCGPAIAGYGGSPACATGYACNGTSLTCTDPCLGDGDCAAGYYCDAQGACVAQKTAQSGATCDLAAGADCKQAGCRECTTGDCVDGYCCNSACTGSCQHCNLTGEAGTCAAAARGDPGHAPVCTPYVCDGTDPACPSACAQDADCVTGSYCNAANQCVAQKGRGSACNESAGADCAKADCDECATGFCVDGNCCNVACGGQCDTCSTTPGTCTQLPAGNAGSPSCTPYLCPGGSDACGASCTNDNQCASGNYCHGGTCQKTQTPGTACTAPDQCATGNCVDGVCCAASTCGLCQACNVAGSPGSCADSPVGAVPVHGTCATTPQAQCGTNGTCDGNGNCRDYPRNTSCGTTNTCVGNSVTGLVCDGLGNCGTAPDGGTPCDPYLCEGTRCAQPCAGDGDCVAGSYCAAGACAPKIANGGACSASSAGDAGAGDAGTGLTTSCQSGFCVEGVCCDTACNGTCQTCRGADQETLSDGGIPPDGGTPPDGVCGNAKAGVDPHGDCADQGAASCATNGLCNGSGACQDYSAGTTCRPATCVGNAPTTYQCTGTGTCLSSTGASCGAFVCVTASGACKTACTTGADCTSTSYCNAGVCQPLQANGAACTSAAQCSNGICVDGVCCNSACTGQCEACDVLTALGACTPVVGGPHGTRGACSPGSAADPCSASQCDGITAASCQGFAGSSVPCGAAICVDGGAQSGGYCDGKGSCNLPPVSSCGNFACKAAACVKACTSNDDCSTGSACEISTGTCASGATCDGQHTITGANGETTDCTPYKCNQSGTCTNPCLSVDDCVTPNVCNPSGQCVLPQSGVTSSSSGCGCRSAPSGSSTRGAMVALLTLAAAASRRRKRRRRPSPHSDVGT